ncbi:hypothetical protein B0O80DRAFT_214120 [Mortierella sp. GBAus27b]|nr:hypothetical protein B0O80DRAFT_214120 [Mortierella sp. GBAus27b]
MWIKVRRDLATVDNALIIGTRSCDALLTSSIRLDSEHAASVGGLTMSFQLPSSSDSRSTSIFLDAQSVRDAEALMSSTTTSSTGSGEGISELRQVRSHFDEISTFTMCRASGDLARNNLCQPYTIFTFALSEVIATTKAGAIADLFFAIGEAVLSAGSQAQLSREVVSSVLERCQERETDTTKLEDVLELYGEGEQGIAIIGNSPLCAHLTPLVNSLMSHIVKANEKVSLFTKDSFLRS